MADGDPFENSVTVGVCICQASPLGWKKITLGPPLICLQQPLGGKAQFGGQRLERWKSGLLAYGAASHKSFDS